MVPVNDIHKLEEAISKRDDIRSVSHSLKKFTDLTGNLWMFLMILFLLSGEWALRKRNGL
jgi:hypothetical protein